MENFIVFAVIFRHCEMAWKIFDLDFLIILNGHDELTRETNKNEKKSLLLIALFFSWSNLIISLNHFHIPFRPIL